MRRSKAGGGSRLAAPARHRRAVDRRFDAHMAGMKIGDTPVNRLRAAILTHVRGKAISPRGVFTLNVPTGGGKTLASLAFAARPCPGITA